MTSLDTTANRVCGQTNSFSPFALFQRAPDTAPPTVACSAPNQTTWYGSDVTVPCTASDKGSGLANPSDASFSLLTTVAGGTETSNAGTNIHQVCDIANNCIS